MKLSEIAPIIKAVSYTPELDQEIEICAACGSDLMSDVLAFVKDQALLLTGLVNPQVVRTAEMMDIKAIIFVRGKAPDEATIALAKEKGICLFNTEYPLYIACGKLYQAGLSGKGEQRE